MNSVRLSPNYLHLKGLLNLIKQFLYELPFDVVGKAVFLARVGRGQRR